MPFYKLRNFHFGCSVAALYFYRLLDWRPDKLPDERYSSEKTVVLKNLFDPSEFDVRISTFWLAYCKSCTLFLAALNNGAGCLSCITLTILSLLAEFNTCAVCRPTRLPFKKLGKI